MESKLLFKCPDCNRKYQSWAVLKRHADVIHMKTLTDDDVVHIQRCESKKKEPLRRRERKFGGPGTECSICLNAPGGECAVIPCGHSGFCYECLNACEVANGCPLCRGPIERIQRLYV